MKQLRSFDPISGKSRELRPLDDVLAEQKGFVDRKSAQEASGLGLGNVAKKVGHMAMMSHGGTLSPMGKHQALRDLGSLGQPISSSLARYAPESQVLTPLIPNLLSPIFSRMQLSSDAVDYGKKKLAKSAEGVVNRFKEGKK
jgi:hypothetical protein